MLEWPVSSKGSIRWKRHFTQKMGLSLMAVLLSQKINTPFLRHFKSGGEEEFCKIASFGPLEVRFEGENQKDMADDGRCDSLLKIFL